MVYNSVFVDTTSLKDHTSIFLFLGVVIYAGFLFFLLGTIIVSIPKNPRTENILCHAFHITGNFFDTFKLRSKQHVCHTYSSQSAICFRVVSNKFNFVIGNCI